MSSARTVAAFYRPRDEPARGARRQNPGADFDERGFDDEETEAHPGGAIDCDEAGPFVFGSDRAEAMVAAPPLGQAAQSVNPIEKNGLLAVVWAQLGVGPILL